MPPWLLPVTQPRSVESQLEALQDESQGFWTREVQLQIFWHESPKEHGTAKIVGIVILTLDTAFLSSSSFSQFLITCWDRGVICVCVFWNIYLSKINPTMTCKKSIKFRLKFVSISWGITEGCDQPQPGSSMVRCSKKGEPLYDQWTRRTGGEAKMQMLFHTGISTFLWISLLFLFCGGGRGWCKYKITPRWFHISSHWFSTMGPDIYWDYLWLEATVASYQVELMAAQDFCQDDEFGILIQKILHQVTDYPILYDGCYIDFSYQQINWLEFLIAFASVHHHHTSQ